MASLTFAFFTVLNPIVTSILLGLYTAVMTTISSPIFTYVTPSDMLGFGFSIVVMIECGFIMFNSIIMTYLLNKFTIWYSLQNVPT